MFLRRLCRASADLQALLRDGYKCAISGVYDRQSCLEIEEIDAAREALDNPKFIGTKVAHIFPESAQDGDKVSALSFLYGSTNS